MKSFAPRITSALISCLIALAAVAAVAVAPVSASAAPPQTRIIGGTGAGSDWPFIVAVLASSDPSSQYCGGTLVDPSWVLTSAHCVVAATGASASYVMVGRTSLNGSGGQVIAVDAQVINPHYDAAEARDDFALLHLSTPAAAPATPIEIAIPAELPETGELIEIAGWGLTSNDDFQDDLQETTVKYDQWNCYESGSYSMGWTFCAGDIGTYPDYEDTRNMCVGDDGGPAVFDAGVGRKLIGIQGWNFDCLTRGSFYVDVTHSEYRNWIVQTMANHLIWVEPSIAFGDVDQLVAPVTRHATLKNVGSGPSTVGPLAAIVPMGGGRVSTQDFQVSGCTGAVLPSGGTCDVSVAFMPQRIGSYSATLEIFAALNTAAIPLSARSVKVLRAQSRLIVGGARDASKIRVRGKGKRRHAIVTVRVIRSDQWLFGDWDGQISVSIALPGIRKPLRARADTEGNPHTCFAELKIKIPAKIKLPRRKSAITARFSGNNDLLPGTLKIKQRLR